MIVYAQLLAPQCRQDQGGKRLIDLRYTVLLRRTVLFEQEGHGVVPTRRGSC